VIILIGHFNCLDCGAVGQLTKEKDVCPNCGGKIEKSHITRPPLCRQSIILFTNNKDAVNAKGLITHKDESVCFTLLNPIQDYEQNSIVEVMEYVTIHDEHIIRFQQYPFSYNLFVLYFPERDGNKYFLAKSSDVPDKDSVYYEFLVTI